MSQYYSTRFGVGDPRTYTGLSPTFLVFANMTTGATMAAPAISEILAGSGLYGWTYGVTQSIAFLIDAATTSPGTQARYVTGQMDPADRADAYGNTLTAIGNSTLVYGSSLIAIGNSNIALGTSNVALGTTVISYVSTFGPLGTSLVAVGNTLSALAAFVGDTTASIGTTSVQPSNIFGFLLRAQQMMEGAQIYTKASGLLAFYNSSQSTMLVQKTVSDTSSQTTKT